MKENKQSVKIEYEIPQKTWMKYYYTSKID